LTPQIIPPILCAAGKDQKLNTKDDITQKVQTDPVDDSPKGSISAIESIKLINSKKKETISHDSLF
jgi:hypothetical protein